MDDLDAHLLPPARLKLVTTLTAVSEAEFATVREALDVSDSVLSKHLGALEDVGYVKRHKGIRGGRRTTWISLTPRGRKALSAHVTALRALIDGIDAAPLA
jgi:DNA-binding MarR family transcriptional regulator